MRQRFLVLFSICLLSLLVALFSTKVTSAMPAWSWLEADPIVQSKNFVPGITDNWCKLESVFAKINGEKESRSVCLNAGDNVSFGSYYSGPTLFNVVSFRSDSMMHRVYIDVCSGLGSCIYSPETDILMAKEYSSNWLYRSLVIYKNFSKRLTKVDWSPYDYTFDNNNPDYRSLTSTGYQLPVGSMATSNNGEWLIFELAEKGFARMNLKTFEIKRLTNYTYPSEHNFRTEISLAITNDGSIIAMTGRNTGLVFFEVNDSCGEDSISSFYLDSNNLAVETTCPSRKYDGRNIVADFLIGSHARFNDSGSQLSMVGSFSIYNSDGYAIKLAASNYQVVPKIDYLALGDSFTSGEGDLSDLNYLQGTNTLHEKCHISKFSYPFLISPSFAGTNYKQSQSVACSGATMSDIIGNSGYWGQGGRLGKNGLNLNLSERNIAQAEATNNFLPGRIRQADFVGEYQPAIITLGIGGNDMGFADKLSSCLGPGTCDWAGTPEGREKSAIEIQGLYGKLVNTYQKLHNQSTNTKIFVIGYPNILDSTGECSLVIKSLLNQTERQYAEESVKYLNLVVTAAAKTAGVGFIDIQGALGDSTLCGSSDKLAFNTIVFGDDFSPVKSASWLKIIGQESFHPNSDGHNLIAANILSELDKLSNLNYCNNGAITCPVNTPAPEPSSYWLADGKHNLPRLVRENAVSRVGTDWAKRQVSLPTNSLAPNSTVSIVITSEPRGLGSYQASENGSIETYIDLPADLEEGYHTIHIYGISYSGEPVEYYQVIKHQLPEVIVETPQNESGDSQTPGNDEETNMNDNELGLTNDLNLTEARGLSNSSNGEVLGANITTKINKATETTNTTPDSSTSAIQTSKPEVLGASTVKSLAAADNKSKFDYASTVQWLAIGLAIIAMGLPIIKYVRK